MIDPLSSIPGYLLRRASSASLAALNQQLAPHNLRHSDASLLLLIGANPGMTQSAAGRIVDIQRANMVPIIARFESQNMVVRRKVDGRSQGLSLTAHGEGVLKDVRHVIEAYEADLMAKVAPEMQPFVVPILRSLWQTS